jgi:uncharacterized hydantoinase/oxoprolinase family protein
MSVPERHDRVLGLDLGNAKLKALYLEVSQGEATRCVWDSMTLPVTPYRALDFQLHVPLQLQQFFDEQAIEKTDIEYVVVCCSHSFGFDPYSDSIRHLKRVLQAYFENIPVALVRADGVLTELSDLDGLSDAALYGYVFTNFYGSAWLGSQCIEQGLSLDMGTTTLDIIPIRDRRIDPTGLGHVGAAAEYLRFRYHQDRIHWLGMTVTPLEKLCQRVSYAGESYQVVPRNYRSDNLFAQLTPLDKTVESAVSQATGTAQEWLLRHAYASGFPEPEAAHRALAESIGLDRSLLNLEGAAAVQTVFRDALIGQVAQAIERVLNAEFGPPAQWNNLQIAVFALGAETVVIPALTQLGFQGHQWLTLDYQKTEGLWSASSVFAMALLALEHIGGKLHWR